ncbi:uncharacterized protein ACNLHF_023767 [Anomaloglossus baeobatrachus]
MDLEIVPHHELDAIKEEKPKEEEERESVEKEGEEKKGVEEEEGVKKGEEEKEGVEEKEEQKEGVKKEEEEKESVEKEEDGVKKEEEQKEGVKKEQEEVKVQHKGATAKAFIDSVISFLRSRERRLRLLRFLRRMFCCCFCICPDIMEPRRAAESDRD